MPLSYRGIPYQPTSAPLETTDSKNLGKYRGSSFGYSQRELIPFPHSFFILKYRGIPYLALGRFSFQSQLKQSSSPNSSPHKNKYYNGKDEE
ncbi:MAG TPA: hypothetical protein DEG17_00700 [Cyanobacteria bacterium UBA11149]|nr:hypothetical protein [Cyanobacteria bacterium UBA11367]HBE58713.1 hypothetical protein [Cyanobacteria bacterium UBA11366]HBK62875.1 hypothetical protein [Cyanobacteria bacterium UBA11166]HBR76749.1 hypothetical protein [Cyanobacteria bacterium UBA11159]HBS68535.1 hypothetical protein [Cyanobacteria bacterium UBA11153]HBW87432.1 hypothetical protein [Cyanobacteria bacterium UBA11149]HCA93510.1 hypothetical protein [Cyanobacteria bacterium UBA9226]